MTFCKKFKCYYYLFRFFKFLSTEKTYPLRNSCIISRIFFIRKLSFCWSLNILNFSRNRACDFLKIFFTFTELSWPKWVTLSLFILYTRIWPLSLNFECNNDVISIFGHQKHIALENEPCDFRKIFLRFWPFESYFLINFSLINKTCILALISNIEMRY